MSPHLPAQRRAITGRTQSRVWDSAEYGAAVTRFRWRATALDRACWVASAALVCATAWLVWG